MIKNRFLRPLFVLAFILNFSRALTFTFFPIYLSTTLGFSPLLSGYALGGTLMIATLGGIYCGILVDRFTPLRTLLLVITTAVLTYSILPLAGQFAYVFILLAALEISFTTMHLSIKSLLTGLLPPHQRGAAFSVNYTLINIAFCTAPILGIAVSHQSMRMPMFVSAGLNLLSLILLIGYSHRYRSAANSLAPQAASRPRVSEIFKALIGDTRLQLFTLGGFFSCLVYARFATYLSQYLGYVANEAHAMKLISLITGVNAITVILLQYVIGRWITPRNMLSSVMLGSGLLVTGLLVFHLSESYAFWIAGTIVFSLGEIFIVPSEFMFIDSIAKDSMKGAYFGVQNISMLGAGLNTVLCGLLLENHKIGPQSFFYFLMIFAAAGCLLYIVGIRQKDGTRTPPIMESQVHADDVSMS